MNLFSKLTAENHPARRQQGHGGSVKKPAPEKTALQKAQDENARLREALHSILMGTKLGKFNRNDDGIVDLMGIRGGVTQEVCVAHLKKWADIIANTLGKK